MSILLGTPVHQTSFNETVPSVSSDSCFNQTGVELCALVVVVVVVVLSVLAHLPQGLTCYQIWDAFLLTVFVKSGYSYHSHAVFSSYSKVMEKYELCCTTTLKMDKHNLDIQVSQKSRYIVNSLCKYTNYNKCTNWQPLTSSHFSICIFICICIIIYTAKTDSK